MNCALYWVHLLCILSMWVFIKIILLYCEFVVNREIQSRKFHKENCPWLVLELSKETQKMQSDVFLQCLIWFLCMIHIFTVLYFINLLCHLNCSSISLLSSFTFDILCSSCWQISVISLFLYSELLQFRWSSVIAIMVFVISRKWSMRQM